MFFTQRNLDPNTPAGTGGEAEILKNKIAELEALKDKLTREGSAKDQAITDLANSKAVLEQRLNEVEAIRHDVNRQPNAPAGSGGAKVDPNIQRRITSILETAGVNPQQAGEELANLMSENVNQATQQAVNAALSSVSRFNELNEYLNKVKDANKDLLPFEALITARAGELMRTGKGLKDAVDQAVKETKESLQKVNTNANPPPLPAGANGETRPPTGPTPPPAPAEPETAQSYIDSRRTQQQKRVVLST